MDNVIVTIGGVILIGTIYWFFFGKSEDAVEMKGEEGDIIVDGGYKPNIIKVKSGQEIRLSLYRKDPNSCLEEFILPDFKIKKYLPLNKKVEIIFTPDKAGEYAFHCGMNMYHGKIIVS